MNEIMMEKMQNRLSGWSNSNSDIPNNNLFRDASISSDRGWFSSHHPSNM